MKDFPFFTTENGVASLKLKEIPYLGKAYITLRDASDVQALLKDCMDFCVACGAEEIYATGEGLERFPLYTEIWEMTNCVASLPPTDAAVFPLQKETLDTWLDVYREKVSGVPMGAWLTKMDGMDLVKRGEGYFVHRNGELLGIGIVGSGRIEWLASAKPHSGAKVLSALARVQSEEWIRLTVASENKSAVRLYERLGFFKTAELCRWYRVKPR